MTADRSSEDGPHLEVGTSQRNASRTYSLGFRV